MAPSRTARAGAVARACHLGPTLAVTTAALATAALFGRGRRGALAVGGAVLAGQCAIGWQNDLIDHARDRAAGRRDKPLATAAASRRAVGTAAALATAAVVPLSLLSGRRAALAHLTAVAAASAYNLGLKATVASPLPYVAGFGLLPCFVSLGLADHPLPPWWLPAASALLGAAAHFANVLPDLEADRLTGVRGLPQRCGRRASIGAMGLGLALAGVLLGSGPHLFGVTPAPGLALADRSARHAGARAAVAAAGAAGLGVVAARTSARRPQTRAPFACALAGAALDVGLLAVQVRRVPRPAPAGSAGTVALSRRCAAERRAR